MSFEEQIISKDKYTSMFQRKVEDIVCCTVHIFFNALKKNVYEHLTVRCVVWCPLSVLWLDLMNKKYSPSSAEIPERSLILNSFLNEDLS